MAAYKDKNEYRKYPRRKAPKAFTVLPGQARTCGPAFGPPLFASLRLRTAPPRGGDGRL